MDKPRTTPKDFFLWAGAMLSLYISVSSFISLLFSYIDYTFQSGLVSYPSDPYQGGASYEMASLIILFPVFMVLMHFIHRDINRDPLRADVWVRRWALMLTLFVAGAAMVIDLIVVLTAFLNGAEITTAFVLKAAIVLLVAAAGFMHFIADFWGYWKTYPMRARSMSYATSLLVILTLATGFIIYGTPEQQRLMLLDEQKVSDLQNIQSEIVSYWQDEQKLPMSLADLNDSISGFSVPTDEQTGQPYDYQATGATSFELCATFNTQDYSGASLYAEPQPASMYDMNAPSDNWGHAAGNVCFNRIIDPNRYPPVKTAQ